jgi:hypothetical protein
MAKYFIKVNESTNPAWRKGSYVSMDERNNSPLPGEKEDADTFYDRELCQQAREKLKVIGVQFGIEYPATE